MKRETRNFTFACGESIPIVPAFHEDETEPVTDTEHHCETVSDDGHQSKKRRVLSDSSPHPTFDPDYDELVEETYAREESWAQEESGTQEETFAREELWAQEEPRTQEDPGTLYEAETYDASEANEDFEAYEKTEYN